ncbi:MAG: tRNA (N6-threonylcarbamoyladenosine(37)-N6)-methyltransferase TrmO [Candidatus Lokiarchaeota archaeon]|nr:tRNA (N6-threonylcarbamoyladenosine(37)-N6)-methyltransferase TrmO [Candidatus Lokiarchaeota archaeon]
MSQIGTIRTPYENDAPYQPIEEDDGSFQVIIDPKYSNGLYKLETFKYIYVIYLIDRVTRPYSDLIAPSWIPCANVGIFASRSPVRPNRIGISIVKIKRIEDNTVFTTGLDVFDGTPLLDIKPYIKDLDSKKDANYGWIEEVNGWEHMILHLKGIPHDY